jgi:hypothetical protein
LEVYGNVQTGLDTWRRFDERDRLNLKDMQESARQVGAYMATVELKTLNDHCLQDLETWDDAHEDAAQAIKEKLLAATPKDPVNISNMGDDAKLIAGATLAFFSKPEMYAVFSAALMDALTKSFYHDEFWGNSTLHAIVGGSTGQNDLKDRQPKKGPRKSLVTVRGT